MKTIFINSYYSEIEHGSGVDGIYTITYDDTDVSVAEVKKLIELTYSKMQDESEVNCLGDVLKVLQKKKKIVSWEYVDSIRFDCDHGEFDK